MSNTIKFSQLPRIAVIGVDFQEDFRPQVAKQGESLLVNFVNACKGANTIILTKSVHPENHFSFIEFGPHCVKGTKGAKICKELTASLDYVLATKISKPGHSDAYSAFEAETLRPKESVEEILHYDGIEEVYVGGFGHSWDVPQTAFDANALKYKTHVLYNATWPTITRDIGDKLRAAGVDIIL